MLRQILMIAIITPWAFVGFESITHSAEEFRFPAGSLMGIFRAAIIVTTLLYAAVFLLSVSVYPDRYGSWTEYIGDLGNLQGIEGLPAFYAAYTCLGNTGIVILLLALLGLVFSSIIGNMTSLSRLFYALSGDRVLPARYKSLTRDGIPARALFLVFLLSLPVMFVGRTAVSWIVDVTTVGAIILYGFASAAALALARTNNDRRMILSGALGLGLMIVYGILTVIESLAGAGGLPRESQLIFIVWSVLGLLCFRVVMIRDHGKRFGRNLTVWVVLVGFIFFLSMLWILEECTAVTADNLVALRNYYHPGEPVVRLVDDIHLIPYQENLMKVFVFAILGVSGVFIVSLSALLSNWHYARKCEEDTSRELGTMKNITYRDPLTGTGSKHAFVEAEENMDILIDQGSAGQFAVLVCDVNGLKHVNDTLGHKAGDEYIREGGELICSVFRKSRVFRTGGDEFVVLLEGEEFQNRKDLLSGFDRHVEANIGKGKVVISAGLSDYEPGHDNSFHTVFERADQLMYTRKQELRRMGAVTRE